MWRDEWVVSAPVSSPRTGAARALCPRRAARPPRHRGRMCRINWGRGRSRGARAGGVFPPSPNPRPTGLPVDWLLMSSRECAHVSSSSVSAVHRAQDNPVAHGVWRPLDLSFGGRPTSRFAAGGGACSAAGGQGCPGVRVWEVVGRRCLVLQEDAGAFLFCMFPRVPSMWSRMAVEHCAAHSVGMTLLTSNSFGSWPLSCTARGSRATLAGDPNPPPQRQARIRTEKWKEEPPPPPPPRVQTPPPPPSRPPTASSPSSNAGESLSWGPGKFFTFTVSGAT